MEYQPCNRPLFIVPPQLEPPYYRCFRRKQSYAASLQYVTLYHHSHAGGGQALAFFCHASAMHSLWVRYFSALGSLFLRSGSATERKKGRPYNGERAKMRTLSGGIALPYHPIISQERFSQPLAHKPAAEIRPPHSSADAWKWIFDVMPAFARCCHVMMAGCKMGMPFERLSEMVQTLFKSHLDAALAAWAWHACSQLLLIDKDKRPV